MPRRCEILTDGLDWREITPADLAPGAVFRLFEEDGTPVIVTDDLTGERVAKWRVAESGEAEPIPESDVERAVRTGGMFWPGGAAQQAEGPPRRLR